MHKGTCPNLICATLNFLKQIICLIMGGDFGSMVRSGTYIALVAHISSRISNNQMGR